MSEEQSTIPGGGLMAFEAVVNGPDGSFPVSGGLDPAFSELADVFQSHFENGEELGASVCVTLGGRVVADLWGGYADAARARRWERDTICNAMSVSKAFTAACLHLLADRGLVDLDAPVARYWPEFGANGKENIPVSWLTDQRAGLPALADDLWPGAIFDWEAMTRALAEQAPLVKPGESAAYHIRTSGFLIGEVVRRVSGLSIDQFLRREITEPFRIDFHFGLTDEEISRTADFQAAKEGTLLDPSLFDKDSLMARAGRQMPVSLDYNGEEYRRAVIPSSNGHGNARAVARFYAILANRGELEGRRLLSAGAIERARTEQHRQTEVVLGRTYRQGVGFLLNTPGDFPVGPNSGAFGVHGMGGALGMCDPEAKLSFGYIDNKMHTVSGLGPRAQNLLRSVYAAIQ